MGKRLTIKQKKAIIRIECSNLLSQASEALFDDLDITEDERVELLQGVYTHGLNKLRKQNESAYFGTGKDVIEYVRKHF